MEILTLIGGSTFAASLLTPPQNPLLLAPVLFASCSLNTWPFPKKLNSGGVLGACGPFPGLCFTDAACFCGEGTSQCLNGDRELRPSETGSSP